MIIDANYNLLILRRHFTIRRQTTKAKKTKEKREYESHFYIVIVILILSFFYSVTQYPSVKVK